MLTAYLFCIQFIDQNQNRGSETSRGVTTSNYKNSIKKNGKKINSAANHRRPASSKHRRNTRKERKAISSNSKYIKTSTSTIIKLETQSNNTHRYPPLDPGPLGALLPSTTVKTPSSLGIIPGSVDANLLAFVASEHRAKYDMVQQNNRKCRSERSELPLWSQKKSRSYNNNTGRKKSLDNWKPKLSQHLHVNSKNNRIPMQRPVVDFEKKMNSGPPLPRSMIPIKKRPSSKNGQRHLRVANHFDSR